MRKVKKNRTLTRCTLLLMVVGGNQKAVRYIAQYIFNVSLPSLYKIYVNYLLIIWVMMFDYC